MYVYVSGNLTYKQKKELQNKANAGSSHNWNTLFLGQNAVADAIANRYNTTKEKVMTMLQLLCTFFKFDRIS
jgi:hypothetical protein